MDHYCKAYPVKTVSIVSITHSLLFSGYIEVISNEPVPAVTTTNITLLEEDVEDIITNDLTEEDEIISDDDEDITKDFVLDDPESMKHVSEGVYHDDIDHELSDEEKDAKILVDVIASIAEWKDRQQRKLLHYLFHRQKRDEEVVCYGELGCFRDEGPFNYLDMLPSPPEEIGTVFYLYTRCGNVQQKGKGKFSYSEKLYT